MPTLMVVVEEELKKDPRRLPGVKNPGGMRRITFATRKVIRNVPEQDIRKLREGDRAVLDRYGIERELGRAGHGGKRYCIQQAAGKPVRNLLSARARGRGPQVVFRGVVPKSVFQK